MSKKPVFFQPVTEHKTLASFFTASQVDLLKRYLACLPDNEVDNFMNTSIDLETDLFIMTSDIETGHYPMKEITP